MKTKMLLIFGLSLAMALVMFVKGVFGFQINLVTRPLGSASGSLTCNVSESIHPAVVPDEDNRIRLVSISLSKGVVPARKQKKTHVFPVKRIKKENHNDGLNKMIVLSDQKKALFFKRPGRCLTKQEKIAILKQTEAETGVEWEILYGMAMQESRLGRDLYGDRGKAVGWFHIHRGYNPEVSVEQALDYEWSARWAANYLIRNGYFLNRFNAVRRYNGHISNPRTYKHTRKVFEFARQVGYS